MAEKGDVLKTLVKQMTTFTVSYTTASVDCPLGMIPKPNLMKWFVDRLKEKIMRYAKGMEEVPLLISADADKMSEIIKDSVDMTVQKTGLMPYMSKLKMHESAVKQKNKAAKKDLKKLAKKLEKLYNDVQTGIVIDSEALAVEVALHGLRVEAMEISPYSSK